VPSLTAVFDEHGADIAAVIVEPVVGNMGCVPPREGYLQSLRDITRRHGALLILDEVMTGFRLARGGAQQLYGVAPDLTTLGKIIGGGLPVGAYGGRRDLMEQIAPAGPVYQAGTLSGNPLAMTAGLAVLRRLRDPKIYAQLEEAGRRLTEALSDAAREAGVATVTYRVGSMFTTYFNDSAVTDWPTAARSDRERYGRFFHAMLEEGVYLAPSQFEAAFISTAHTDDLLDRTAEAARKVFRAL
jgi:glutamate-1-semialdehyde 2,1-aminomutase